MGLAIGFALNGTPVAAAPISIGFTGTVEQSFSQVPGQLDLEFGDRFQAKVTYDPSKSDLRPEDSIRGDYRDAILDPEVEIANASGGAGAGYGLRAWLYHDGARVLAEPVIGAAPAIGAGQ